MQELAAELGVHYTLDPTITPMMDGDTSVLSLRIPGEELKEIFRNPTLVGNQDEFCAPPKPPSEEDLEGYSCSAGHSFCYISPYGDVFPCVQFPLPTGNIRQQKFLDIWNFSPQMKEVRSIQAKDSDRLLVLLARQQLHALSGTGLYGRKHARPIHRGLREVILPDGHTDGEHAAAGAVETTQHVRQYAAARSRFGRLPFPREES